MQGVDLRRTVGWGAIALIAALLTAMPAVAQKPPAECFNLPDDAGAPSPELIELCGGRDSIQGTFNGDGTNAFGWESVADALNSLDLGDPGVLTNLGGANPTGGFVGACDFFGNDFSLIYCLTADSPGTLFTVTTDGSGVIDVIGTVPAFGSETFTSLDYNPADGMMYGLSTNITAGSAYVIDVMTPGSTRLGSTGALICPIAGGFNNAGDWFAYGICTDAFYGISTANGASTNIGPLGFNANFGQGMDFDATTDECYMFAFNSTSFQPELRLCDTSNGSSTFIPPAIGSTSPGGLRQIGGAGIEGVGEPAILLSDVAFTDQCLDPAGNTNGVIEPGEGVFFDVELSALVGDFTGISAVLVPLTAGVEPFVNASSYPDLAAGESALGDAQFVVELSPDVPCLSDIDFEIEVTSNEGDFLFAFSEMVGLPLVPDVPQDIPDNDPGGVESTLVVADDVTLTDVDVRLEVSHTWVGDTSFTLTSPGGTTVVLLDQPGVPASTFGCSDNNMNVTFDDDSAVDLETWCMATDPWYDGVAAAVGSLADFNGESSAGTWTLTGFDGAAGDTGTIVDWDLITTPAISGVCDTCDVGLVPPVPVVEIPTLAPVGLLLLLAGLAGAGIAVMRRRK